MPTFEGAKHRAPPNGVEKVAEQAAPAEAAGLAEPAQVAPRGRGRPKGCGFNHRIKTTKFSVAEGVDRMTDLASNTHHPWWAWDGKMYPKTKRSHGPNADSLNRHAPVLMVLMVLAPNGYPDPYRLRDLFVQLHSLFNIFEHRDVG